MRYATWCASLLSLALFLTLAVVPAHAQATRTWVSGVGDDANPCSRTAPCKTFAGAISKTAPGGSINCIDPGGFGALTITKSITVKCDGLEAGVLVSGTNGITVNAAATDVVMLSGLDIDGLGTGLNGINFVAGAALYVNNCMIRNFNAASPNGSGIRFAPNVNANLFVADTTIYHNGTAGATVGAGIFVQPSGTASAAASVTRTRISANGRGIDADSTATSGSADVTITDSTIAGNINAGIVAISPAGGGPAARIMMSGVSSVNNNVGLNANGASATIRLGNSVVTHNSTGISAVNSGIVQSYKSNLVNQNTSDGTPINQVPGGFSPNGLN
jgi:hypothetical protein